MMLARSLLQRLSTISTPIEQGLVSAVRPTSALSSLSIFRPFSAAPEPIEDNLPQSIPIEQHTHQGLYQDLIVPLYTLDKEQIGTFTLGGDVFDVPIRKDILHRVVRWQLARRQQGTHKTKTRSEVAGGGRKPRPQKGSGRSRQGTIRAPQWRGGGVSHGPVPRSHEHSLFKRVRRLGLKCALSAKAWEKRLIVVDTLQPADHKTKTMDGHLKNLLDDAPRRSVLFIDSDKQGDDGGELLRTGSANLPWVDVVPARGANVYSILQRDYLVISKNAVELVMDRLRRQLKPWSPTP